MAIKMTPAEYRDKHARRLKASIEDMRKGIERVDKAPGASAAEAADKWHARMQERKTKDKWARKVAAVSLDEWKGKMINKGLSRVAGGIDAAAPKVEDFADKLFRHQNGILTEIDNMPSVTLEDGIARATHWIRRMSEFQS